MWHDNVMGLAAEGVNFVSVNFHLASRDIVTTKAYNFTWLINKVNSTELFSDEKPVPCEVH